MIVTVTLNPAIDRTLTLEDLCIDKVNRISSIQRHIGGKGINVSKTIQALGAKSKSIAVLGGKNGRWLFDEALKSGLDIEKIDIDGETRENFKIVDAINKTYTDLNEAGPQSLNSTEESLISHLELVLSEGDTLVLAGSPLPGMDESIFKRIIEKTKYKNIKTAVDIEGKYLERALEAKPMLIKPNIHELEAFLGRNLETTELIIKAARELIEKGIRYVVVSRGEDGLLWIEEDKAYSAKSLKVEVKSTVGAGDAVVAALVTGLEDNLRPEEIIKRAVATATSVIMTEGSATGKLSNLKHLESLVEIESIG